MRLLFISCLLLASTLAQTGGACDSNPCLDGDDVASCSASDTGVVFSCDPGSGSQAVTFFSGTVDIAHVPLNAVNLEVSIENPTNDVDVRVFTESGECLAGYGCSVGSHGTGLVNGMNLYFSGDDTSAPVTETIRVDKALEPLEIKVLAYGPSTGNIVYSWGGIDPCDPNADTSRTCSCTGEYTYEEGYGCKGEQTQCASGVITSTEMCQKCKCGGINRLSIASDGRLGLTEDECFAEALSNGHMYVSYRAPRADYESACVYGDSYSSADACLTDVVSDTRWKWTIYELLCADSTCSGDLTEDTICTSCKCNGASRKTHTGYNTKDECRHHAYHQGYEFFSWRENKNLCWFGDDTACGSLEYKTGVNAEWGLYRVECPP